MSVFGNDSAASRAKSRRTSPNTAAAPKSNDTAAEKSSDAAASETASATSTPVSQPRKPVFRKVGEPFVVSTYAAPQTSTTPQQQTPAQRDATRPPGTEQQQTAPPSTRTSPPDPRTPPGTTQQAPTNPPGMQTPPVTAQPPATQSPTTGPTPTTTQDTQTGQPTTTTVEGQDPNFPAVQPRPVPPMPSLTRVGISGEDTLSLSLNDAIRRTLENNNEIEIARGDVRLAEQTLYALEGVYDPVFTYTPQINNSVRPVVNIFGGAGTAGTVSTTDYNNDVAVNRQVGRGGGNFTYFFNNTREKTSATNNSINPIYSSAQGIQFTQPLWRDRSIDRNRQQIRIQRKRLEQSDADFRRRTIDVIQQVQRSYWDLVFAMRNEQNQVANVKLAQENFRRTEASVAAGASAPLQRAEVETELSTRESALLVANQQVTVAENALKQLMLKDPLAPEWSRALVPTDQPSFDDRPVVLETALKEARDNRPELRRLKLESQVSDINLQFYRNQTKPRIDLTGTLQTNGLAGSPGISPATGQPIPTCTGNEAEGVACIPQNFVGGYGRTLQNLFNFKTRQVVVGVTIQLPFKNKTAKANLAATQIQAQQLAATTRSQDQAIEVEVRDAVQAVETARRRVLSARQALASAETQLAGERRLYQVGRSTTFLLFQRENALVNAQNQELQAETDYNKALADLQRATSSTLRSNNVIVDSPVAPEKFRD
ncbi:MAG TPA: TolC family protein [Pyrinomonadaceae bacterium]|nr:TolC family protein [Pyrinomonadaceae bacterium]